MLAAVGAFLAFQQGQRRAAIEASRDRLTKRRVEDECQRLRKGGRIQRTLADQFDSLNCSVQDVGDRLGKSPVKQGKRAATVDQSFSSLRGGSFPILSIKDEQLTVQRLRGEPITVTLDRSCLNLRRVHAREAPVAAGLLFGAAALAVEAAKKPAPTKRLARVVAPQLLEPLEIEIWRFDRPLALEAALRQSAVIGSAAS